MKIILIIGICILILVSGCNIDFENYQDEHTPEEKKIYRTYQLENGDVVECADWRMGNNPSYLRDCKDGFEYIQQKNVKRLK